MAKTKKKSRAEAVEKELKATVRELRARLADAEASLTTWRKRATDRKEMAAEAKAELAALRRRLAKAEASAVKWKDRAKSAASRVTPAAPVTAAPAAPAAPAPPAAISTTPDDTWTLAALRAEARSRGLTGYSRKTKAQLLEELGG